MSPFEHANRSASHLKQERAPAEVHHNGTKCAIKSGLWWFAIVRRLGLARLAISRIPARATARALERQNPSESIYQLCGGPFLVRKHGERDSGYMAGLPQPL